MFVIYMAAATALMIWQGVGIAPDRYAFVLLLGSLLVKRTRSFIMDWAPFLFILISYDFLRGFADNLNMNVHFWEPIIIDQWMFKAIPTATLQKLFFRADSLALWDYLSTVLYFLHFALPLSFGYLLWLYSKDCFRQFVVGISFLSYAAWVTFLAFPVAPPWMAGEMGYLPGVVKILDKSLSSFPVKYELPTIYHNLNPNPVAAIPSLHAAYPFLVFLFALRFFGFKALLFSPYVLGVFLSMVYLGEHYVIDIIIGILYSIVFYFLSDLVWQRINWKKLGHKIYG